MHYQKLSHPVVKIAVVLLLLVGCNAPVATSVPSTAIPSTPTPRQEVLADTFFSGCAYLDQDGDEGIDPEEPLLGGLTFTVTLAGGAGFGDETSEGQCAFITVPSALPAEAWPIVARMIVPDDLEFKPIGSSTVTLEFSQTRAEFLFRADQAH